MSNKELGNLGEKLACEYLVKNGYKIIGRNYRINFGEIDIIAKKRFKLLGRNDRTIHFIEVKSLLNQGKDFFPEQKVGYEKQNKYRRLVEVWLEKNKLSQNYPCQVDVIAVSINDLGPKIDFFENVVEN